MQYIPLEKPLAELETKISELKRLASTQAMNLDDEIVKLEKKASELKKTMFNDLTPYEMSQISRHPDRPTTLQIIERIGSNFVELHGDRNFLDDGAVVGGLAKIEGTSVVVIGHQKGKNTKENIQRNFGMPRPEGYRKALRLMTLAERFNLPIITFIDTPGAYPGVGAEERGQSEAIAKNIMVMNRLKVPIITFVVGEGGSGGALALAVANKVYMLQYSIYSVISPEGCASILMKDGAKANLAADALKLTAEYTEKLGIVDAIIEEPTGGAHRNIDDMGDRIKEVILKDLKAMSKKTGKQLREERYEKFLKMGVTVGGELQS